MKFQLILQGKLRGAPYVSISSDPRCAATWVNSRLSAWDRKAEGVLEEPKFGFHVTLFSP